MKDAELQEDLENLLELDGKELEREHFFEGKEMAMAGKKEEWRGNTETFKECWNIC